MCIRTKNSSALILVLALFSPLALADAGQFYIAPGLQWMNFDDSATGFDDDEGYFFGIGYDFTDRISAELSTFDLDPETAGGDVDVDHYKLDLIYNFDKKLGAFDTFAIAGLWLVTTGRQQ